MVASWLTQPMLLPGIYCILLWALQLTGNGFMGPFFFNPKYKNQMQPYGLGQSPANYFYTVNSTGCLAAGLMMLAATQWDATSHAVPLRDVSLVAAVLFGLWAIQNGVGCFCSDLFRLPTMYGNVYGCGICCAWHLIVVFGIETTIFAWLYFSNVVFLLYAIVKYRTDPEWFAAHHYRADGSMSLHHEASSKEQDDKDHTLLK